MTFTDYISTIYLQDPKVTRDIALEDWIINEIEQDATILNKWVDLYYTELLSNDIDIKKKILDMRYEDWKNSMTPIIVKEDK